MRVKYLDGLRAIAALSVVVAHSIKEGTGKDTLAIAGVIAVAAFITLSGYCLCLPSSDRTKPMVVPSFGRFMKRRARRILPPYYAALVLSLAVCAYHPSPSNWYFKDAATAFRPAVVISHLFLVHNVNPPWSYPVNPPLWTIATEWQIYPLLPLLLAIYTRAGLLRMVIAGVFASAVTLFTYTGITGGVNCAHYELISLFTIGAALALIPETAKQKLALPLIGAGIVIAIAGAYSGTFDRYPVSPDIVAILLITGAICDCFNERSIIRRVLENPVLVWVGVMSYSLYLVHGAVIGFVHLWISNMAVDITAAIAIAYAFHLCFERPFLSSSARSSLRSTA